MIGDVVIREEWNASVLKTFADLRSKIGMECCVAIAVAESSAAGNEGDGCGHNDRLKGAGSRHKC